MATSSGQQRGPFILLVQGEAEYARSYYALKDKVREHVKNQPGWAFPISSANGTVNCCCLEDEDDARTVFGLLSGFFGASIHIYKRTESPSELVLYACNCAIKFLDHDGTEHIEDESKLRSRGVEIEDLVLPAPTTARQSHHQSPYPQSLQHHQGQQYQQRYQYYTPNQSQTPYQTPNPYALQPQQYQYTPQQHMLPVHQLQHQYQLQAPVLQPYPAAAAYQQPTSQTQLSAQGMSRPDGRLTVNLSQGGYITEHRSIFLQNLHWSAHKNDVSQFITSFGLHPIEINHKKTEGTATARFRTKEEATQAIFMLSGQIMRGRSVGVRHDTNSLPTDSIPAPGPINARRPTG